MPARDPARLAVLVSGSGSNLQALLDAVADDPGFGGEVVVVASDDPDALGLERARKADVPAVAVPFRDFADRTAWEAALVAALEEHRAEVVVSAGFMRLLSPAFLARWPQKVINLHPALLPSFPGMHGVRDALAHGVKVTGSTVHFVDEQVDHGPIVAQTCVPVLEDDDEESLRERVKAAEHEMLPRVVKLLCQGRLRIDGRRVHVLEEGQR